MERYHQTPLQSDNNRLQDQRHLAREFMHHDAKGERPNARGGLDRFSPQQIGILPKRFNISRPAATATIGKGEKSRMLAGGYPCNHIRYF